MVIDDCFSFYDELKRYTLVCDYQDEANPIDGVVYPAINRDIPRREEVLARISELVGREIQDPVIFFRMSKHGVNVPHIMHTDKCMGSHSMMTYFHDQGGTGFAKHNRTGMAYHPDDPAYAEIITKEGNTSENWSIVAVAEAKENRSVIFDSSQIHCALPFGGFGNHQSEARVVMTCFFS